MIRPFVPHFILRQYQDKREQGQFQAATLFIDISGFTGLTEALIHHQREGAEALTDALEAIFNPLVRQVHARGGIIPLFAGDAFTAVFPQDSQNPQKAVLDALHTACFIQSDFADHQIHTKYGDFVMGVKMGLSWGQVQWGIPHFEETAAFYFRGEAMSNCAYCQQQANMGDIVVDEMVLPAIGPYVTVEPLINPYYRLTNCLLTSPTTEVAQPAVDEVALRPFLPPAVLDLQSKGEFREICPIFISFDEPEEADTLHAFIVVLMALVKQYGGTLSQLDFGDKGSLIVLWFGAPMTYENNIERAAECLLALQTADQQLHKPLRWRAGITFGIVWAGIRGGVERSEYGAVGDVVNLAARIAVTAEWGEIWVSEAVHERIKNSYRLAELGVFQFKGKLQHTKVYRLIRSTHRNEISFYTDRMIGREEELRQLHRAIQPVFDGRFAGVIYTYGEAGIGKSRLLFELQKHLTRQHRLSWFHCPAEEILRQSLNPFKHFLFRYFEQAPEQTADTNQNRFHAILNALLQHIQDKYPRDQEVQQIAYELERTRSMLAALVGLHWRDSLYEQLEPKLRFQNTLTALRNLIMAESLLQPVVMEMEDAHWLDDDSQEMLYTLTRAVSGYPIAILCAGRYSDDGRKFTFPLDASVPEYTVELNYLSAEGVRAIAEDVVRGVVTQETVQFLLQTCNGNPFFVEQVSLDLKERGLLTAVNSHYELHTQRTHEVPSNINAVLIARLDRLTAEVKQVVQTAAVLGREFELLILGRMLHHDSQLPRKIKTAEDAQIWATLNNIRYIFKHALLRDSAYDMQMRARLRQLHKLAAQAIEEVYTADLTPYYADLAYHYDQAHMQPQAARWYRLAGVQATARYGNEEAVNYFTRALELLAADDHIGRYLVLLAREQVYGVRGNREAQFNDLMSLGQHADSLNDPRRRVEVALRLTKYAHITGDFPAAISAAQIAVMLAHPVQHQQGEAEGYLLWGRSLWRRGDFEESLPHLEKALALARSANLRHIEADALRNLGIVFNFQGNLVEAELNSERALQIYRQIGDQSGENAALNNLGEILLERGEFAKSGDYYSRALLICQQTGERELESVLRHSLGRSALQRGSYGQAQRELERALQISYEINNLQGEGVALAELGYLHFHLGRYETARNYYEEALHIAVEIGDQQVEGVVLAYLGLLYHRRGDTAVGWEYVQQALRVAQTIGDNATQAMALTIFGHVLLGLQRYAHALEQYREALLIRREMAQGHRAMEPLAGLARVYLAQGDKRLAQSQALEVWNFIRQQGWAGIQEPFQVCLSCYEVMAGVDMATAVAILSYTHDQVQNQAARIETAEFRDSFLHRVAAHARILVEVKLQIASNQ